MDPSIETSDGRRRILVTWGTKLGGTEGIARVIGEVLDRAGYSVDLVPAANVRDPASYDGAIIGGALYSNRWHREARRFVERNVATLRRIPVWRFSSGPLDASADRGDLPAPPQVAAIMERIGAREHVTFGGRLAADAKGFPARTMAKSMTGDWRNPERIRAWATGVARALPDARPRSAIDPPARSPARLIVHGVLAAAPVAMGLAALARAGVPGWATVLYVVLVPVLYIAVAHHYFRPRGARDPSVVAVTWLAISIALDIIAVAGWARDVDVLASFAAVWIPAALAVAATWITGFVMSTMPWPKSPASPSRREGPLPSPGA